MPNAISSNAVNCHSPMTGNAVDAVVVVFDDGSSKVLCPEDKTCHTAGLCNYQRGIEPAAEPAEAVAGEEKDPIGSVERSAGASGVIYIEKPEERDPVGSVQRPPETVHQLSDEDIFY
ncbi:MAG: hypothetical protein HY673_06495 [Chloroflexi bacterium]|nr:hypothetical protein [Chloroflexota bacterium]